MYSITTAVKNFLFPGGAGCPLCGRRGSPKHLCRSCLEIWAGLARGFTPCEKCGRFSADLGGSLICKECQTGEQPFIKACSVAPYEGSVREALHYFKFCGKQDLAYPLGELLAALAAEVFPFKSFAAVVPVPLHEGRLRERGFNQAALLADVIGRLLKIPLAEDALVRKMETPSQTSLSKQQRQANLKGVFESGNSADGLQGKSVLLVDDVFTTGATVQECSLVLKASGVQKVYVAVVAAGILRVQ